MPPCPLKGGFVLEHKHTTFKNENESRFAGLGGKNKERNMGWGQKGKRNFRCWGKNKDRNRGAMKNAKQ
jgi:hypothetical protein